MYLFWQLDLRAGKKIIEKYNIKIFVNWNESFHPLGNDIPKCLYKIANKPILAYQLEFLERNKINEVNIVTNKKYHQQISDYLFEQYQG